MNAPFFVVEAIDTLKRHRDDLSVRGSNTWQFKDALDTVLEYIERADLAQTAPVPSDQALSDAYDRGVAFAVRKFVEEQAAPTPVPDWTLEALLREAHNRLELWDDGTQEAQDWQAAIAWLNSQRPRRRRRR